MRLLRSIPGRPLLLRALTRRNFCTFSPAEFLSPPASATGGYTTANYIWDLMRKHNVTPLLAAVEAYYTGLKEREVPADDPRLMEVKSTIENRRSRFRGGERPSLNNDISLSGSS